MSTGKSDTMIKELLKTLSCNNGWSYGVFWGFDQRNSSLFTLQEVYIEEQMGVLIDDMLLQVHILGGGVIGQAAFTKNHKWMFSDAHFGRHSSAGSVEMCDIFQDYSELDRQFSFGIKTIAVIPVERLGVVQFGSIEKLPERMEFVNQTKELFRGIEFVQGLTLPESEQSSSASDTCGLFTSLISCETPYFASPNFQHNGSCKDFKERNCSVANITQSFSSNSDCQKMNACVSASSACEKPSRIIDTEANADSIGKSSIQSHQSLVESSTFFESSSSQGPHNTAWSFGDIQESSILNSVCSSGLFSDVGKTSQMCAEEIMSSQNFAPSLQSSEGRVRTQSSIGTFQELLENNDFEEGLSKYFPSDDLVQWFSPTTSQRTDALTTALSNDLSHASGVVSLSSKRKEHDQTKIISDNQPSTSVQSSISNAFNIAQLEKRSDIFGTDKLFGCSGLDLGSQTPGDWEDILMPIVRGGHLDFSTSHSECISDEYTEPKLGTTNTLFSKLGLYQYFDGITRGSCSASRSDFDCQLSSAAKRRKLESDLLSSYQEKCLPRFAGDANTVQSVYHLNNTNNFQLKREVTRKLQAGSCTGDSGSIIAGHTISPENHEKPTKAIKKKAKPGTKPRPKDRQQIRERLADLRELIPNGEKMSIDRLLHRTIKHLLFLQSVTRHAENFEQTNELKNEIVEKEIPGSSNGVIWACEVEDETVFCPLIVEDLTAPGQMLIEIHCEEQGFFLEIVDIVRGFGLNILKGVMEVRETKMWARFTVEAEENQRITRHEIFSSLVQFLQLRGPTDVHKSAQLGNTIDGGASIFNNCQQSGMALPVCLATKF